MILPQAELSELAAVDFFLEFFLFLPYSGSKSGGSRDEDIPAWAKLLSHLSL